MITVPWTRRTVVSGETAPEPKNNRLQKALTATAMTGVAFAYYNAQQRGLMTEWDYSLRWFSESSAHPALGYIGAFLGCAIAKRHFPRHKVALALAGATAVNFVIEAAQSAIASPTPQTDFLAGPNMPQTIKDWAFAVVGGAALYLYQDRAKPPQADTPIPTDVIP